MLYENLSADCNGEMKRTQDFLGVDYEVVKPSTYKQCNHYPDPMKMLSVHTCIVAGLVLLLLGSFLIPILEALGI